MQCDRIAFYIVLHEGESTCDNRFESNLAGDNFDFTGNDAM